VTVDPADYDRRFARFAWGLLLYTIPVILWGAYVRASLSGDGCGDHWPLCDGELLPVEPSLKKAVEFTHRVTSGLAWVGALVGFIWSRRAFGAGRPARRAAGWVLVFMTTEALVGAAIVLLRMVASNPSLARAGWMGTHLMNTFLLLAAMTLLAWSASGRHIPRLESLRRHPWVALAIAGMCLTGISGAVAALGDTLFPASSLSEAIEQDFSPAAHLLLRLRIWHPFLALGAAAVILILAGRAWAIGRRGGTRKVALVLGIGALAQVMVGLLNVALLAPIWLQLVHLLLADLLWVHLVLLWALSDAASLEVCD